MGIPHRSSKAHRSLHSPTQPLPAEPGLGEGGPGLLVLGCGARSLAVALVLDAVGALGLRLSKLRIVCRQVQGSRFRSWSLKFWGVSVVKG